MHSLQNIINSIPECSTLQNEPTYNIFKNDQGYDTRISEFKNQTYSNQNIGLLIGPGSLISILPEVPCESIIVCDINKFVIESTRHTISIFQQSSNVLEYIHNLYNSNNPYHQSIITQYGQQTFCEFRDNQIWSLRNYHLENTHTRFIRCKDAIKNKKIYFLPIDLNDQAKVQDFGNKLNSSGYQITFADFSNVHEYISNKSSYATSLSALPFTNPTSILYSSITKENPQITSQPICTNLEHYLNNINI